MHLARQKQHSGKDREVTAAAQHGKMKSSTTCDGSSPEPLAELPAPLGLGVFLPGDLTGPGRVMGVKEIKQGGREAFRRDGEVPRALGLSPLPCHCSLGAAFEQEQGRARCLVPTCALCGLLPSAPGAGCSQLPLASVRSPPRPPALPPAQHPLLTPCWRSGAGSSLCPPPVPRLGPALPFVPADPVLMKPGSESCSLSSLSPSMFTRKEGNSASPQNPLPFPPAPPGHPELWGASAVPEPTAPPLSLQQTRPIA